MQEYEDMFRKWNCIYQIFQETESDFWFMFGK